MAPEGTVIGIASRVPAADDCMQLAGIVQVGLRWRRLSGRQDSCLSVDNASYFLKQGSQAAFLFPPGLGWIVLFVFNFRAV
jgi:hypothetical protein